jgi:hypothetical protein
VGGEEAEGVPLQDGGGPLGLLVEMRGPALDLRALFIELPLHSLERRG